MLQTLFHIPNQVAGMPLFGFGLLLAVWAVASVVTMTWLVWRHGPGGDTLGYLPLLLLIGALIWLVLPRLCDVEGLPIRGYGVMMLLAVSLAVGLTVWRARRLGVNPDLVLSLAFWAVVPGILGARLFYIIQKWPLDFAPVYREEGLAALLGALVNVAQGGLVFYGSVIGGVLGMAVFIYRHRLPPLATLDLFTPGLMLGLAIGRLGCFLNGCCYGGICELPWAVTFPAGSPPHRHQLARGETYLHGLRLFGDPRDPPLIAAVRPGSAAEKAGLAPGEQISAINGREVHSIHDAMEVLLDPQTLHGQVSIAVEGDVREHRFATERSEPVHPTQLYGTINALLLCLFLLAYDPFHRRDGELFAMMLTLYPVTRFLLEIIRNDEGAISFTHLTISQNVSLLLLASAIALWFYTRRKPPGLAFSASYHVSSAGPANECGGRPT